MPVPVKRAAMALPGHANRGRAGSEVSNLPMRWSGASGSDPPLPLDELAPVVEAPVEPAPPSPEPLAAAVVPVSEPAAAELVASRLGAGESPPIPVVTVWAPGASDWHPTR